MRFFNRGFLLTVSLLAVVSGTPANAILKIDITQGNVDPLQIAIPEFTSVVEGRGAERLDNGVDGDIAVTEIGAAVVKVIAEDLRNSGLFAPLDKSLFIQSVDSVQVQPRFADWRVIDAQALITGRATLQQDGRLKVEFRLWDVLAETQMTGYVFATTAGNWRRVSHMVADAIYKRLTGEDGYFDTRIVYVSESGARNRRVKRLAIMDQDGARHRYLTDGGHLVLTPRFSPTSQEITYLSYFGDRPRVYLFNIDSGKQEVLGDFPGMTFAPRFSPDGNKVIMSLARNGNSDIYVMDLRSRETERLTKHPSIDTSPSYSPDSERITFNSDRGGTQQLYVADANGRNVKRISFGDGRYATPVWSPRGDLIAFTKMRQGRFYIGVMRVDGSGERLLSESFLDEGPTWSPNGRVLMFFRQEKADDRGRGGDTRLWSVDLTGYNERLVPTPLEASDPAWSPLIK